MQHHQHWKRIVDARLFAQIERTQFSAFAEKLEQNAALEQRQLKELGSASFAARVPQAVEQARLKKAELVERRREQRERAVSVAFRRYDREIVQREKHFRVGLRRFAREIAQTRKRRAVHRL